MLRGTSVSREDGGGGEEPQGFLTRSPGSCLSQAGFMKFFQKMKV